MNWTDMQKVRIALLDLYEGQPNQGMRCIHEIVKQWGKVNDYEVELDIFEVRIKQELPTTHYDVYISTGGPGSPLYNEANTWETPYFNWLDEIYNWNNDDRNSVKKHVLFICHSFQLACRYYNLGNVCKRISTSFGIFPIHLMQSGKDETIFEGLRNPFYAVDSRDYQVIEPNHKRIAEMGGKILAIEKERIHVPYERAVMAMRINEYFIGTQFHPEADAEGMSVYLQREDKKKTVIENHGEDKWKSMIEHLNDPNKIEYTHNHVVPNFLNMAVGMLVE